MKTTTLALRGLALVLAVCIGCGDDTSDGDDGVGGGGGAGGQPPTEAQIAFAVRVVDATAMPELALADVEVCVADHPEIPCATSDASGALSLTLPVNSELMLRCEGPDHGPMYMTWAIGEEDIDAGKFSLLDKTKMGFLLSLSGAESWPGKGAILVNVYDDLVERDARVADATFAIVPQGGGGPVYVSEQKLPDKTLTASTVGGPGVFFDLENGEVTVSVSHGTRTCTGGFGWPTSSATSLRSKVFAGGLSSVTFVCPP